MKVVFNLSPAQSLVAIAIKAKKSALMRLEAGEGLGKHFPNLLNGELHSALGAEWEFKYDGNLAVVFNDGMAGKQTLELSEDNSSVTYEGGRTTLVDGMAGCILTLREIAGGDEKSLKVISYETTDPSLSWWETTSMAIRRKSDEELAALSKQRKTWRFLDQELDHEARRRIPTKLADLVSAGKTKLVSASFTPSEIRRYTVLKPCLVE